MCATFSEISSLETTFQNSLRVNYENFDRIEDRKLAITFKAQNFPNSHRPYFVGKYSEIRYRLVLGSRSTEIT